MKRILFKDKKMMELYKEVGKITSLHPSIVEKSWNYFIEWQLNEFRQPEYTEFRWPHFGVFKRKNTYKKYYYNNLRFKHTALQMKVVLESTTLSSNLLLVDEFDQYDSKLLVNTQYARYCYMNQKGYSTSFNYVELYLASTEILHEVLNYLKLTKDGF